MARKPNWLDPFLQHAGIPSQEEFAALLGVNRVTVNRKVNDRTGLDREDAAEWAKHLRVSKEEVMLRKLWKGRDAGRSELTYAPNPEDEPAPEFDPDSTPAAGYVDGIVLYEGTLPNSQPEMAARSGAGPGQMLDNGTAQIRSNGIASGHPVVAEWVIPSSFLQHGLGGSPSRVIIVPVIGHSMEPRLFEGDRVMVDLGQNSWVADAIYVIDDGDLNLQVKTVRKVTSSSPPRFRIVSEASPDERVELGHEDFRIVGRVVGRISRP